MGIPRKKTTTAETSTGRVEDLLPTDLEAVSPGSVNDDKPEAMDTSDIKEDEKMDVDDTKIEAKEDSVIEIDDKEKADDQSSIIEIVSPESESIDKSSIPLPAEEIKLENIPAPENSPPNSKNKKIDLEKIDLPKEPNLSTDIPLPDEMPKPEKDTYFKPIQSEEDDSSSDSSLRRNMSPLTPIRNFNNENSCDAQQAFENDSDGKSDEKKEPSTFRFTIETKSSDSSDKIEKKPSPEQNLSYQFNQVNINTFNTPLYDDSSNSHNLQIDYESDVNSKMTDTKLPEAENSTDSRKEKKEEKKSHKSSHRSRDSHRHSSSKDKDSKHSSRDSSRHDKKKDDKTKSSKEKTSDKNDKDRKDSRDSSKHRSSHKSSSSSHKDTNSKSHRSSSSSKHSSKTDDKKSSSSKDKDKSSDKSSKDRSKSSSHRSDKDKKSKSKSDEKENKEKKEKKETDDHYGLSGRGNPNRRSTDRDSNDGSSSSKGSHNPTSSKSSQNKKDNKSSTKSDNTSTSTSTSPSDKEVVTNQAKIGSQTKPIVRVDTKLEIPIASPPRLPFVPDVTMKKPRFAANLEEAKRMIKMRKFLEEEQKRMNQEAALLLEFQANVRPSLSQVYSSIPGPELEFACISNASDAKLVEKTEAPDTFKQNNVKIEENVSKTVVEIEEPNDMIARTLIAMHQGEIVNDISQEEIGSEFKEEINENKHEESLLQTLNNNDNEHSTDEVTNIEIIEDVTQDECQNNTTKPEVTEITANEDNNLAITIVKEELSEIDPHTIDPSEMITFEELSQDCPDENLFKYFAEHEKYNAELERDNFTKFLKTYTEQNLKEKLYLINCDSYEENLIREVADNFGDYDIVNYYKNGHLKLPKTTQNIVKNVNVTNEITLPTKNLDFNTVSPAFSPVKSECSFELSSDYDAKLEEMVNKTSRQQIMEIILGNVIDDSPTKMPRIDYCMDSNIEEAETAIVETDNVLKRKLFEVESTVNNNRHVLTPNKIRKLSGSDQISSTTEGKLNFKMYLQVL